MSLLRDPGTNKASVTRVTVLMLATTACVLVGAVIRYMFLPAAKASVIAAIGGIVTALVGAGCVAILNRTVGTGGD